MTRVKKSKPSRVCQGDIFRSVEYPEYTIEKSGSLEISIIEFPLVIVLTQDCDLEQDYAFRWGRKKKETQDKYLLSVLVAPLYNAEHVFRGEHLSFIDLKMREINKESTEGKYLLKNQKPRYHYLEFPEEIRIVPSIIDFKHYFAVNVKYLKSKKKTSYICKVSELYREDISQRFSNFLSRIGLP